MMAPRLPLTLLTLVVATAAAAWPAHARTESDAEKSLRMKLSDECEKAGGDGGLAVRENSKAKTRSYQCTKDGKVDGKHSGYFLPGLERESSGQVCNGKICGHWERWDRAGNLLDAGDWENGLPNGEWVLYRVGNGVAPGTRREAGVMVNGQRACGWTVFTEAGAIDESASAVFCGRVANAANANRLRFGVGVGVSSFSFNERTVTGDTAGLAPRLGVRYRLNESLNIGFSTYFTAVVMGDIAGETARYVGANLRLDYRLPFTIGSWIPSIAGGLFYSRMLVTNTAFGYGNLLYPQIFPSIAWPASFGTLAFYAKFVPIGRSFFDLSLTTREVAAGVSFEPKSGGRSAGYSVSLDVADLLIRPAGFDIHSNSVSLGIGFLL